MIERAIDLRSDTVTRPTEAMRAAMASAEVGDDVYGEDPTVRRLEERVAQVLGKEAALYCASGAMTNQIAIHLHTRPGDEVILHEDSHPVHHEAAGAAALSGVALRTLPGDRGLLTAAQVRAAIRPAAAYHPRSRLLVVENTHNMQGGTVWPLARLAETTGAAREGGLGVHMDGARLWNAAAASGVDPARYAALADTVSVCFSKGLGAPVGSALVGTAETIREARRVRHRLGGGWRQAGVLAAAALHALAHHRDRLVEDHDNARALVDALRGVSAFELPAPPETNLVFLRVADGAPPAHEICRRAAAEGVLVLPLGERRIRAVTHLQVSRGDVLRAAGVLKEVAR